MENFEFRNITKIIFGKETENQVGNEVKNYGNKVLLHYGSGSIKKYGLYNRVLKSLKKANIKIVELGGVQPNPRLNLIQEGIKVCRDNSVDLVLAVGGGSVIDSAKGIAVGVPYDGNVWDFALGKATAKEALPVGVVLTIPAAGSESSQYGVVTNEEGWYKRDIVIENFEVIRPKFAILNPELTFTLPFFQTACGAVDIMAHAIERYFTQVKNVELTDRFCEGLIKTVINNTRIVFKEPKNYNARAEIMWAGSIAQNDFLHTGRIPDFGTHMIEHEVSGIYDVTHGAGLAVLQPAWMKYVYKENIEKFAQFAVRVWNEEVYFDSMERVALKGIENMSNFYKEIGLPTTLKALNIPDERFEEMAEKCVENGPVGNFKKLYKDDVIKILNLAK